MHSLEADLTRQNHVRAWIDCHAHGLAHRWQPAHVVNGATYWRCTRAGCAVRTRTSAAEGQPGYHPFG